ncbi:hypothetical protein BS78_02G182600 [Paspalum vaginatum]|nr:hypothetical protein BS78_02G182600 [Paspalum vaginatum]
MAKASLASYKYVRILPSSHNPISRTRRRRATQVQLTALCCFTRVQSSTARPGRPESMATVAARLLLLLLAVAGLVAVAMAEHEVLGRGTTDGHDDDDVYQVSKGGQGSLKGYQCSPQCSRRCANTQYKKPCLFFCNKCCNTCLCVPSGYYGNKGECPCYNNWKTKRGGPKCP